MSKKPAIVVRYLKLTWALPALVILAMGGGAGCGYNQGFLRDSITRVQVDRGNFQTVAVDVSASVSSRSILCVIPGSMKLTRQLMKELHRKGGLRRNQMFINFRQDYSLRSMLFIICTYEHTLTADIIEFDQVVEPSTSSAAQGGPERFERSEPKPRVPAPVAPVVEKMSAVNGGGGEKPEVNVPEVVVPTTPVKGSVEKAEEPAEEKPAAAGTKKPKKKARQVEDSDPIR